MKLSVFLRGKESNNAMWLIGGKIIQMLLSLVVGVITARYLGPSNYGLINYGAAWVAFFTALSNLGINSVIVKEFVDHPDEQGKTIGSALLMRFISSVLSAITIICIVSILDSDSVLTITVVALCSIGLIFNIFETLNYWFQAQYKSKIVAIATLIAYIATSVYKIVLLVLNKDVRWFAFASSVDYIVIAIILLVVYKRYNGERFSFSAQKSKSILKSSYHYILSSMMVAIYGHTDRLMLKQMVGDNEVAYYSTAASVCSMWVFVLAAIIDSMYPTILRLYSSDKEEYLRKNRQLYAIVFYVTCFVSLMFLLLGDWVIRILYGDEFSSASLSLKIITWYTAFSYLGVARNAWIVSEGKQAYLKYLYTIAAFLNVLLNFILIPHMGAAGAAIASLVTQMFTSIILPAFFKELRSNTKLMIDAILLRNIYKKNA